MNISDMSPEQAHNTLALALTNVLANYYPTDRTDIWNHVDCALKILYDGLNATTVAKMTGSLNEVDVMYMVDLI